MFTFWPRLSQKGVISTVHPSLGGRVASVENIIYLLRCRCFFFGVLIFDFVWELINKIMGFVN